MGTIYARGRILWTGIVPLGGTKQECKSSELIDTPENRAKLRRALNKAEEKIAKERARALATGKAAQLGPMTVKRYGVEWLAARRARGVPAVKAESSRLPHFYRVVGTDGMVMGARLVVDVRQKHVRDAFQRLTAACGPGSDQQAPRSVRALFGTVKAMFLDVVSDELLEFTPCILAPSDLPKNMDKDPDWRDGAVYVREEVEQLMSDPRLLEDHRVRNALLFLSGMRIGETAARHFKDYDPIVEPLGMLKVDTSYSTKRRQIGPTKTGVKRRVPVHPALAKVLAAWKLGGWERMMGRPPTPDDLLIPKANGEILTDAHALAGLREDLERLGLRRRSSHDTRATFISIAQDDGVPENLLRWLTHGRARNIMAGYTRGEWNMLCGEVLKLKLGLRDGKLLPLPLAAAGGASEVNPSDSSALLHPALQSAESTGEAVFIQAIAQDEQGSAGISASYPGGQSQPKPGALSVVSSGVCAGKGSAAGRGPKPRRSDVVNGSVVLSAEQAAHIRAVLRGMRRPQSRAALADLQRALALLSEGE